MPRPDPEEGPSPERRPAGTTASPRAVPATESLLVRRALIVYAIMGLGSLVALVGRDGADVGRVLVGPAPLVEVGAGLAVGLAAVLASLGLSAFGWARRAERALSDLVGPLSTRACLVLAVSSGLGEELLFRGVLQPWLGLLPTALLFGLVHVPPRRELLAWPVLAALMGVAFGALQAWSGAVLAPAVAHATVNAINLRRLARGVGGARAT